MRMDTARASVGWFYRTIKPQMQRKSGWPRQRTMMADAWWGSADGNQTRLCPREEVYVLSLWYQVLEERSRELNLQLKQDHNRPPPILPPPNIRRNPVGYLGEVPRSEGAGAEGAIFHPATYISQSEY